MQHQRSVLRALAPLGVVCLLTAAATTSGCEFFKKNTTLGKLLDDPGYEVDERDDVDQYDAGTDDYTSLAPLPLFIDSETGAAVGQKALLTAGGGARTLLYDLDQDAWTEEAPLPEARSGALALTWGTKVVIVSGTTSSGPAATVDLFDVQDPAAGWLSVPLPPLGGGQPGQTVARSESAAAIVGGELFIVGGRHQNDLPSTDITVLDLASASTTPRFREVFSALPEPRLLAGCFVSPKAGGGHELHVVSGHAGDGAALATDVVIDAAAPTLVRIDDVPTLTPRLAPQVVVGDTEVLVLMSRVLDGGGTAVDMYDLTGGGWGRAPAYPRNMRFPAATYAEGLFLVFGGLGSEESKDSANALDLIAGSWRSIDDTRERHKSIALTIGGRATVIGGYERKQKDRGEGVLP